MKKRVGIGKRIKRLLVLLIYGGHVEQLFQFVN